jgi:hypothetical protein
MILIIKKYMPQSDIIGETLHNPPETGIMTGWLDLTTLEFHDVREKIGPKGPYINGKMDSSKHFYPDGKEITDP